MTAQSAEKIVQALQKPLVLADLEFRMQSVNKGGYATILIYKNARVDMARLDEAVGVQNWERSHNVPGHCTVSIDFSNKVGERDWVSKSDAGEQSNQHPEKGLASSSFKRACTNFGIGRELYDFPKIIINLDSHEYNVENNKAQVTWEFKLKEWVWFGERDENGVTFLACKDNVGKVRWQFGIQSTHGGKGAKF